MSKHKAYREEAKQLYRERNNISRKWIDQYGNVNPYNNYQQNRACLLEVFNMLDVVMENCIDDFRHSHILIELNANGHSFEYVYEREGGSHITFAIPTTFALRVRALRAIGYPISDDLLYNTRLLRNETIHGNQTIVIQHINLDYDKTINAMFSMADALIVLGMMDEKYRVPTYEMMRVREGDTLRNGVYQIKLLIDEGGMSRVYKALQSRTGLELAIKEMKSDILSDDALQYEGNILRRLHHNLIPQVHDTFFENGTYYIVMDFVNGITLDKYLHENILDNNQRRNLVFSLLDVLNYLHSPEIEIAFADLSPNNILIDHNGNLHLIDFGTSVRLNAQQKSAAGTIGYAAPEVLSGEPLDERTDIFSFGYLLRLIYTGLSPSEKSECPTEDLVSDKLIVSVINKCTDNNPEARYQSIYEVKEVLFPKEDPNLSIVHTGRYKLLLTAALLSVCFSVFALRLYKKHSEDALAAIQEQNQKEVLSYQETIDSKEEQIADYEGRRFISAKEAGIDLEEVIDWKDEQLEQAVRNITGIADGAVLYKDLWNYDTLELPNYGIENIAALSDLVNLTRLNLSGNHISDISTISNLKELKDLDLSDNIISDISSLNDMAELRTVDLSGNQISTPEIKGNRGELTSLNLSNNPLCMLCISTDMGKLQTLQLENAKLSSILMEGDLDNLLELNVSGNQLETLSFLNGTTSIEILNASGNPLNSLESLSGLSHLKELHLNDCGIKDLKWLPSLKKLETLSLKNNKIADITPLTDTFTLTALTLDYNPLNKEAPAILSSLNNLEILNVENCSLSGLDGFERLDSLIILDVSDNTITDLSPISNHLKMTYLDAANNDLSGDLGAISKLNELYHLELQSNRINDISALGSMNRLEYLDLSHNCISDFSPIDALSIEQKRLEGQEK